MAKLIIRANELYHIKHPAYHILNNHKYDFKFIVFDEDSDCFDIPMTFVLLDEQYQAIINLKIQENDLVLTKKEYIRTPYLWNLNPEDCIVASQVEPDKWEIDLPDDIVDYHNLFGLVRTWKCWNAQIIKREHSVLNKTPQEPRFETVLKLYSTDLDEYISIMIDGFNEDELSNNLIQVFGKNPELDDVFEITFKTNDMMAEEHTRDEIVSVKFVEHY